MKCRGIATRTEKPTSKDYPSVRLWLKRRGLIKICEKCGYDKVSGILIVHHKDRDRTNNNLSNLIVLCPNCHAIEHYCENKNGWKHKSTKRKQGEGYAVKKGKQ
jgi:RNase P subunit RPR2